MCRSLVKLVVALTILSLGSLISERAQAGASSSASTKYNYAIIAANQHPVQNQRHPQTAKTEITSFSSSSAKRIARRP